MKMFSWSGPCAAFVLGTSVLLSCGGDSDADEFGRSSSASTITATHPDGSHLAVLLRVEPRCTASADAMLTLDGAVATSSAVMGSVEITVAIAGAAPDLVASISPDAFVSDGQRHSATFDTSIDLAIGTHELIVCFNQYDAANALEKEVCTAGVLIDASCTAQPGDAGTVAFDSGYAEPMDAGGADACDGRWWQCDSYDRDGSNSDDEDGGRTYNWDDESRWTDLDDRDSNWNHGDDDGGSSWSGDDDGGSSWNGGDDGRDGW